MSWLRAADRALFLAVNRRWTCGLLDHAMPRLTDLNRHPAFWGALVAMTACYAGWRRRRAWRALLAMALTVGVTDATAARLLKPLIHRVRPSTAVAGAMVRVVPPGDFSFPSNHAANTAAAAAAGSLVDPPLAFVLAPVALVVAYSRMYVGVHYPLDVIGGMLLGTLVAVAVRVGLDRPRRVIKSP